MQKGRVFLKNKMFISLSCIISFLFIFDTKASADSNQPIAPEVETTIIQEFNEPYQKKFTMQATPESVIEALNFVEKSTDRKVNHLLKYVYPYYTESQLKSVTANLEQANEFLHSQNYNTKIVNGSLDTNLLKVELSNKRPVIAFLTANGDYWIEQETAVLVYGYQKISVPNQPSMIMYMYKSLNHGKGFINDATKNEIFLLMNESTIDPSANVTFKWDKTLYGFYK